MTLPEPEENERNTSTGAGSRKANLFNAPTARLISTADGGKRNIKAMLANTLEP